MSDNYRLEEIRKMREGLELQLDKRKGLRRRCNRILEMTQWCEIPLTLITTGLGVTGIGLLTTVVAAPAVIVTESVAVSLALITIAGKYTKKRLKMKLEKHERIITALESVLNNIKALMSQALEDNHIKDEEFVRVLAEVNTFRDIKAHILKDNMQSKGTLAQELTKG